MRIPLLLLSLSLIFILVGCLQQAERPVETAKPTEVPTTTPAPTAPAPTTDPTLTPTETTVPTPIVTPEPEKEIVINLVFPNGTVEENGTYFLGEFTENFTFRVEPKDARVYFNNSGIDVVNGTFVISVGKGGTYTLRVIKDELEKAYNISIGHGEIIAAVISIPRPGGEGADAKVKIFFEDSSLAINRTIIIQMEGLEFAIAVSDENGMVPYECLPYPGWEREVQYIDNSTGKMLLRCFTSPEFV